MPSLNIVACELLEGLRADVWRDLVFDQLPVPLRRPGGDLSSGFPLVDTSPCAFGNGDLYGSA